jgi:hypothetical protein
MDAQYERRPIVPYVGFCGTEGPSSDEVWLSEKELTSNSSCCSRLVLGNLLRGNCVADFIKGKVFR